MMGWILDLSFGLGKETNSAFTLLLLSLPKPKERNHQDPRALNKFKAAHFGALITPWKNSCLYRLEVAHYIYRNVINFADSPPIFLIFCWVRLDCVSSVDIMSFETNAAIFHADCTNKH
ncbi:hypothetical protein SLEP1_g16651 [Rubroshorea leprosula]|uniref:Uncharacterized protein n=1 Tax=Rubroshorea leprosula TaxID=152421 RepID=A0AAV5J215_9ROSI|nr:hypothetical protein SLEP1_g16651 [Rubroshorea leprosula]